MMNTKSVHKIRASVQHFLVMLYPLSFKFCSSPSVLAVREIFEHILKMNAREGIRLQELFIVGNVHDPSPQLTAPTKPLSHRLIMDQTKINHFL